MAINNTLKDIREELVNLKITRSYFISISL